MKIKGYCSCTLETNLTMEEEWNGMLSEKILQTSGDELPSSFFFFFFFIFLLYFFCFVFSLYFFFFFLTFILAQMGESVQKKLPDNINVNIFLSSISSSFYFSSLFCVSLFLLFICPLFFFFHHCSSVCSH